MSGLLPWCNKRHWQFWSCSLLSNLHTLGTEFHFSEADTFNNSIFEEGQKSGGGLNISRSWSSHPQTYLFSEHSWWRICGWLEIFSMSMDDVIALVQQKPRAELQSTSPSKNVEVFSVVTVWSNSKLSNRSHICSLGCLPLQIHMQSSWRVK